MMPKSDGNFITINTFKFNNETFILLKNDLLLDSYIVKKQTFDIVAFLKPFSHSSIILFVIQCDHCSPKAGISDEPDEVDDKHDLYVCINY